MDIIKNYDVVIDATDNVATRYLLNDACVLSGKPLVSGSALRFEGQLSVFNYKGPCYRCIFPKPPSPNTVTNCGDGGVLGAGKTFPIFIPYFINSYIDMILFKFSLLYQLLELLVYCKHWKR